MIKPELLSPAGDFERLKAAVTFGADAVYLAGCEYGMRASQTNFNEEQLKEAVEYCHAHNVRVYLTLNTLPRNNEIDKLPEYLKYIDSIGVDAVIVTDIGVLTLVKKIIPNMEIHISTQAGVINYATAQAFYDMGAKRVVLARELSIEEVAEIRAKTSPDLEIEAFVHGAMCMSVSGRCLISNYLTGRDANRGECAQPCRWNYYLMEEKRPGQYFPIGENEHGSYILNAKDMCMLPYIDMLKKAGITSFKIEGRAKSSYYVSVITNAYRIAIDESEGVDGYKPEQWLVDEVQKVSHRKYSTGFYLDRPDQYYENGGYTRDYDIVAVVTGCEDGRINLVQKNRFEQGELVEILSPGEKPFEITIANIKDENGELIDIARHPEMALSVDCDRKVKNGAIVRRRKD